jgi:hypothetical protein
MKSSTTITFLITLSCNLLIAQVPQFEWVTGPHGTGRTDFAAMADITTDTFGNVILSVNFSGTVSFGSTTLTSTENDNNICIVKYNVEGDVLWARRIGDGSGMAGDIASDIAGNLYLTGSFGESVNLGSVVADQGYCLVKLDPSGNVLWVKQATDGIETAGKCIKTDPVGNIYVGGSFLGTPSFEDVTLVNEGGTFLAKYDPSGNVQWVRQCTGSGGTNGAYGIGVDKDGNSVITGWFDGTILWGTTSMTCDYNESFAVSYNTQGDILWVKHIGQGNWAGGFDADYDDNGNCYLTGWIDSAGIFDGTMVYAAGSGDGYVAKYGPSGNLLWVRTVGGVDYDICWGVDVDPYENVLITGFFENSATFGSTTLESRNIDQRDIFLSKMDASGNILWAKRAGSDASDQARGVAVSNKGRAFTTGWILGTADFDSHEFSPTGTYGVFLTLLEANYINLTPTSREVGYTTGSTTFSVDANVTWNVSEEYSWISTSINGNTIEVDYEENPSPAERFAQIIVYGDGCKDTVSITQDAAPCKLIADPDTVQVNAQPGLVTIFVDSNSEWNFNEVPSWMNASKPHSDTLSVHYTANEGSDRSASITLFNSCLESNEIYISQTGTTGINLNQSGNNDFSIFPNPTNDKIYLESKAPVTTKLSLTLISDVGKKVFSQEFENLDAMHPIEIDMGALPPGIYFLQISMDISSVIIPVLKE